MSVFYDMQEKITINDTTAVPAEIIENIAQEISRIRALQERGANTLKVSYNTGSGWEELTGRRLSRRSLLSVLRKNKNVTVFFDFDLCWRVSKDGLQMAGFDLEDILNKCDSSIWDHLSFELYNNADCSDDSGIITQIYKKDDGTIFKGEPEYEEISVIPDAFWCNNLEAVFVFSSDFSTAHDPDALNAAFKKLNDLEYSPEHKPAFDFHNPEEEASIWQPKFETAEQRKAFFEALEELRVVTGGEFHLGLDDELEWVDESTEDIRMLKMTINKETGETRFFMTRSVRTL